MQPTAPLAPVESSAPPFEPLGRVPAELDPSKGVALLAEVVELVGEERRRKVRLLTFVRNGDLPWTYIVADSEGQPLLIHHDAIRRWRAMVKRA